MRSFLFFVAVLALAQTAPNSDVTLRTSSTEVVVDVVVRDKRGRPVRDLKLDELTILEDGKVVKPLSLRLVGGSSRESAKSKDAAATAPVEKTDATRQLRLVTIMIEPMPVEASRQAKDAASELVKRTEAPNTLFAVMRAGPRLRPVVPFSNNKPLLLKGIETATMARRERADQMVAQAESTLQSLAQGQQQLNELLVGDLGSLAGPALDGPPTQAQQQQIAAAAVARAQAVMMLNMLGFAQQIELESRGIPVLRSLRAAIRELAKVQGRKVIVYISAGMQIAPRWDVEFRNLITEANTAGVSIYTVDANGLDHTDRNRLAVRQMSRAVQALNEAASTSGEQALTREQVTAYDTALESTRLQDYSKMAELATGTGGLYLADSNDLSSIMGRVADDIGTYYEVSYLPENGNFDGRFRSLDVGVSRKGATVQARKGYFAMPPEQKTGVSAFEVPLLRALEKDAGETFAFRSGLSTLRPGPEGAYMEALVEVPLAGVTLFEDAQSKLFRVRMASLIVFRDGAGKPVERLSRDITYQGPLERVGEARKGTYTWHQGVQLAAGEYSVEVALLDHEGQRISVQRSKVRVESSASALRMGDPLLVKAVEGRASIAADDPLQYGGAAVIPQLPSKLAIAGSDAGAALYVLLSHDPKNETALELEVEILQDGVPAGKLGLPISKEMAGKASVPYVATLPGKGLEPGTYELLFTARKGAERVSRKLTLEVAAAAGYVKREAAPEETVVALKTASFGELEGLEKPSLETQTEVIRAVTERARTWVEALPNFFCVQSTELLTDAKGSGSFKHADSAQYVVVYSQGKEAYSEIKKPSGAAEEQGAKIYAQSHGEFGGLMQAIFSPESDARFSWKRYADVGGERMQVIEYKVDRQHSRYKLTWPGKEYKETLPGYHGEVYIDDATYDLRRITLETEEVPTAFPLQQATHEEEFGYVKLGDYQFLLPVKAVMQTRVGKRRLARSEMTFTDYRKWSAESRIID